MRKAQSVVDRRRKEHSGHDGSKDNGDTSLGNRLIWCRTLKRLDLQEAAKKLGISIAYLSRLERGLRHPGTKAMFAINRFYKIPMLDMKKADGVKR